MQSNRRELWTKCVNGTTLSGDWGYRWYYPFIVTLAQDNGHLFFIIVKYPQYHYKITAFFAHLRWPSTSRFAPLQIDINNIPVAIHGYCVSNVTFFHPHWYPGVFHIALVVNTCKFLTKCSVNLLDRRRQNFTRQLAIDWLIWHPSPPKKTPNQNPPQITLANPNPILDGLIQYL